CPLRSKLGKPLISRISGPGRIMPAKFLDWPELPVHLGGRQEAVRVTTCGRAPHIDRPSTRCRVPVCFEEVPAEPGPSSCARVTTIVSASLNTKRRKREQ